MEVAADKAIKITTNGLENTLQTVGSNGIESLSAIMGAFGGAIEGLEATVKALEATVEALRATL